MRATLVAAAVAAASLLAAGCTSDQLQAQTPPSPAAVSPTQAPSPTWVLKPVKGERIPTVYGVTSNEILGRGAAAEPDTAAIDAMIVAIGDFLDQHLDDLQHAGDGHLTTVASEDFRAALDASAAAEVATTALASPDRPVKSARYHIAVYHDGAPQWASVTVDVGHPDGTATAATLVFVPAEDGGLRMSLVGPEGEETG